jgi:hypothetical protein
MRKTILSLVSLSILASLVSACSPSMNRFADLSPRLYPYAIGEGQHTSEEPVPTPIAKVNSK